MVTGGVELLITVIKFIYQKKYTISGPHEGVGKVSSEEVGYYFKSCCLVTTLNYFTLYQYLCGCF